MTWQDAVFAAGQVAFISALVPAFAGDVKPPLATSLITGVTLLAFGLTYVSMRYWYSAVSGIVLALGWLALAAQAAKIL